MAVTPTGNRTDSSSLSTMNALSSTTVTESGTVADFANPGSHPIQRRSRVPSAESIAPPSNRQAGPEYPIFSNRTHPSKASGAISATLAGMTMDSKEVQSSNALSPMAVTPSLISTTSRSLRPR